eukprot:g6099.t1
MVTREDLGRATWTLLHSIAAQYPTAPSRQQQRDAKNFVETLSRLYPCEVCAHHFQEIIKTHPPKVASNKEFQHWMCDVHNTVNRSLKKPTFNCSFLQSRWGAVDCGPNGSCKVNFKK